MIGREGCEAVLDKALALCQGEDADFYLSFKETGLTRFANNGIHQNVSDSDAQLHVRVILGQRLGRAVTNDLSDHGIAKTVEQARQAALLMPEDPDFPGLPEPTKPATVDAYDPETASCSPEDRAEMAALVCRKAEAGSLTASGAFRTGTQETAAASTRGVCAYHAGTFTALLITMTSDSSSGWAKGGSWRVLGHRRRGPGR